MAVRALQTNKTKRVTHPEDTDNPTVWIIRALSPSISAIIRDETVEISSSASQAEFAGGENVMSVRQKPGTAAFLTVMYGLGGFENFETNVGTDEEPDYEIVECKTKAIPLMGGGAWTHVIREQIEMIPDKELSWLANKIQNFGTPDIAEVKK